MDEALTGGYGRWAGRTGRVALALIILIGAVLRLHDLAARSIWYDEGFTLAFAKQVDASFSFFSFKVTSDAPMMAVLTHFWEAALQHIGGLVPGSTAYDFCIRLIPCAFSILAIPLTFWVCLILFQHRGAALLAAALYALSPFQVFYAQELKPYSLYLCLSLGTLACFVKALETNRTAYWVGFVLCLCANLYSHFFSAWNVVLINAYFLLTLRSHARLFWRWLASQVVAFAISLPAILLAYHIAGVFASVQNVYTIHPDWKSGFLTFKTFWAGYTPNAKAYWGLFLICGVLYLRGLVALRRRPQVLGLMLMLTVLPIAANVVVWRMRHFPMYEHRLFIFSGALCAGMVAYGVCALRRTALQAASVALIVVLTAPCLADYYAHEFHPLTTHRMGVRYKVASREAALYIAERLAPGDVVGHASHFTYFPFLHYLQRARPEQHALRLTEGDRTGFLAAFPNEAVWNRYGTIPIQLEGFAERTSRLWLVESWWEPFDLNPNVKTMRQWLDAHFIRTSTRAFDGLTVYLYENPSGLAQRAARNRLRDEGDAVLLDYDWRTPRNALPPNIVQALRDSLIDGAQEPARGYGTRFGLVSADENGAFLDGQRRRCSFEAGEPDGPAVLRIPDIGVTCPERGTLMIGSQDSSLLAVDVPGKRGVLASFPLRGGATPTYAFEAYNETPNALSLDGRVYEPTLAIEPLEFSRSDYSTDLWTPGFQPWGGPPSTQTNAPMFGAHVTNQSPAGVALFKDVRVSTGEYLVFLWVNSGNDPVNRYCASVRILQQPLDGPAQQPHTVGIVCGNDPGGPGGWEWRSGGVIQSDGRPFRLSIAAYNEDQLPEAWFGLGRVLLVNRSTVTAEAPLTRHFTIALKPGERQSLAFGISSAPVHDKDVLIELFDPAAKTYRNLSFHMWAE